jgi:hypothetical protein
VVALLVWTVGVAPVTYFWPTALTHGWTPGSWILVALAVAALGAGMALAYREKLSSVDQAVKKRIVLVRPATPAGSNQPPARKIGHRLGFRVVVA